MPGNKPGDEGINSICLCRISLICLDHYICLDSIGKKRDARSHRERDLSLSVFPFYQESSFCFAARSTTRA